MRRTAIRILKHGVPAALVLAVIGYVMAEMAGAWVSANVPVRANQEALDLPDDAPKPSHGDAVAETIRNRLPFTMAAWGFGLVVVLELFLRMWRGNPAAVPPKPPTNPNADVEHLLNQLLLQADADRAAMAAVPPPITEPPPP